MSISEVQYVAMIHRCAILALLIASCRPAPTKVTIFAASSLREVVTEIAGDRARLSFESSSLLSRQIREGAEADIFISADADWAATVPSVERYEWLTNRLVCVTRPDDILTRAEEIDSVVLGDESVPAGKYARATLKRLPPKVVLGSNVRDVLSKVVHGAARAGIVYRTDAAVEPRVRIAFEFPQESHPKIVYVVCLVRDRPEAREMFEELRRRKDVALRRGFE